MRKGSLDAATRFTKFRIQSYLLQIGTNELIRLLLLQSLLVCPCSSHTVLEGKVAEVQQRRILLVGEVGLTSTSLLNWPATSERGWLFDAVQAETTNVFSDDGSDSAASTAVLVCEHHRTSRNPDGRQQLRLGAGTQISAAHARSGRLFGEYNNKVNQIKLAMRLMRGIFVSAHQGPLHGGLSVAAGVQLRARTAQRCADWQRRLQCAGGRQCAGRTGSNHVHLHCQNGGPAILCLLRFRSVVCFTFNEKGARCIGFYCKIDGNVMLICRSLPGGNAAYSHCDWAI